MSTETATATPQHSLLTKVCQVLLKTRPPTEAQQGAIVAYIGSRYPDADDDNATAACQSVEKSVVLSDEDKLEIVTKVRDALKSGNYNPLLPVPAEEPPAPTEPPRRFNALANATPVDAEVVDTAEPKRHRDIAIAPATPAGTEDAASLMARAIQLLQASQKPAAVAPIDEDAVKKIVLESVDGLKDEVVSGVSEMISSALKRFDEAAAKTGVHRIEVGHPDGKTVAIEGATHWQFEQILTWLTANVPVWLWGKAGGGKTHLGRQLAAALDVPAYIVSIDPTITVGKLVGYRNLATGEYVPGLLTAAYRDGGLLMLDEIDTGDPGILACLNSFLANGHYLFPNGETIERHPKFRVIAGANTKGTGAVAGYTARQRLDAATLNRFAIIELKYDERLEETLALGSSDRANLKWWKAATNEAHCKSWVAWVQKVRAQVGESVLISPRASYLGVAAIRAGVPISEVAAALVFALTTSDTQRAITSTCGIP